MTGEKQVRQIVREELDEQGRMTRRGVLGLLGGGAVAGALTGSASGAAQTDGNLSLADVTADTYRIAGDRYGGPASARSQLESELGNSDAGAKYLGEDNGSLYHWTGSSWELMESTSAAVNTAEVFADYLPNRGISSWNNDKLSSQKKLGLPSSFERVSGNPKISPSDVDWTNATVADPAEVQNPSVISTENLANPNGKYRCYFAPHDTDGIGAAWFDDPESDWSVQSDVVIDSNSAGEPSALYRPSNGEVWIYSSRANNDINLHKSSDGLTNWSTTTDIMSFDANVGSGGSGSSHLGYPNAIQTRYGVYLSHHHQIHGSLGYGMLSWSEDGESNWRHMPQKPVPLDGPDSDTNHWVNISLIPYLNGYLGFYQIDNASTYDIHMLWTTDGISFIDIGRVLDGDGPNSESWEEGRVSGPDPFWYDGELYIAYNGGPTDSREIGIAKANFEEVRP